MGVECALAVIGKGGPVKQSNIDVTNQLKLVAPQKANGQRLFLKDLYFF